jgi:energy-coupling factor transporter ATP-binding protein EcfA2
MAIVDVCGFSFAYPGDGADRDAAWVLRDVTLSVEEGSFCVLTGPTGCGKTTLLRSLKPELAPVGERAGHVDVLGIPLVIDGGTADSMAPRDSAALIGYVMQDPDAQIVCDTVWHEIAFGLENIGMSQDAMRRRIAEVAHFLGIEPWMRANTETLSGGQKQLVNLAGVLALRPRLLLLDEPTAQLDPNARRLFLMMLERVNRELGITVIMATHAPEDVERMVTHHVEMGPVGDLGKREDVERVLYPRWRDRRAFLGMPVLSPIPIPASAPTSIPISANVLVSASAPTNASAPILIPASARTQTAPSFALDAHEVFFRYERTAPWVLRGVDVRVRQGSVHAFVGGNGCGKSTLLKVLSGIVKPQRGRLANALRASQAMLPQDPKTLFVCDSVAEELDEWRQRCGYAKADEAKMLERFGLAAHAAQHPYDLSGGQQQKLAFAKLLLTGARLLLLDEPTKGLDAQACADAVRIVRGLADEGRTVVLVTHDLDFAYACADEVSMLFDGEVACTQPTSEFFAENLVYRPNEESRLFGALL